MNSIMKKTGVAVLALSLVATSVNAAMIKDNDEIFSRLLITAIANEIRENCSTIEAREIKATFYVLGIVSYAKRLGFTMDEIDAFRNDVTQQERLRAATYKYLDENGVDRAKKTGYCELGQTEIAKKSPSGKLIKITR